MRAIHVSDDVLQVQTNNVAVWRGCGFSDRLGLRQSEAKAVWVLRESHPRIVRQPKRRHLVLVGDHVDVGTLELGEFLVKFVNQKNKASRSRVLQTPGACRRMLDVLVFDEISGLIRVHGGSHSASCNWRVIHKSNRAACRERFYADDTVGG
jgi:hypothetical protein